MADEKDAPIRSELAGDPDLTERLEAFLMALGERIDLVQEAEAAADLAETAERSRALASDAQALGFPPLARAAERCAELCAAGDAQAARKSVVELTDVVRRVRIGHRALF